ncbi:hypothetical protein HII31_09605 [Pseudocercospora fuligena]|uniref:Glycine zipper 2TM domain-containing protein n=1 Tax=Pseudocercospora fuligena TaxID=685502 RepID=A0A8H6RDP3_9PEZI|nr:hypothetical protein HII31_09605 [Pseudocercospora fuligena]
MSQAPRREQTNGGSPPGQGYYNAYSEASGYDDRFQQGPQPHREAGYVPYQDSYASFDRMPANSQNPRDQYGYSSPPPRDGYGDSERGYSERAFSHRPYAPSEPRPHAGNQLSPYDEAKADAGWREYDEQQRAYTYDNRPPPSDYGRRPPYDDRYYDDRDSRYDDREYDRDYDRRRRRRSRRYSDDDLRQKALRYPSDPKKGGRDVFGASDGERGMGAQLLGGAAGALLGHKFADGALGTVGGAVLGAIASGAAERHYEKRKEEKVYKRRSLDDGYAPVQYPPPGHDMDDVRRTGRDGRTGIRERLRSMSRGATARFRSRSRPRRSPSLESDERYHYR